MEIIMNYEKKYKEALERAKNTIEVNQAIPDIVECVESLFPELAESRDEEIRKSITEFFKNYSEKGTWKAIPDVKKWIDWLEKQGEQKPWSEEDDNKINSIKCLLYGLDNYNFDNWLKSIKDRVQQKQEWSEWDRILQDVSISYLCNLRDTFETKGWDKEQIQKCISWLQSRKDRYTWKPSDEQMEALNDVISSRDIKYDVLSELWKDLEKLREE